MPDNVVVYLAICDVIKYLSISSRIINCKIVVCYLRIMDIINGGCKIRTTVITTYYYIILNYSIKEKRGKIIRLLNLYFL